MTDQDPIVRRLELLETNVSGQSVALNALLAAFETLSASLAELVEDCDDPEELDDRLQAVERRQQLLTRIVRDMHGALEELFHALKDEVDEYHSHSRELAAIEEAAAASPGGDESELEEATPAVDAPSTD